MKTQKQWEKLGYIVKEGEKGTIQSSKDAYGTRYQYFSENQVEYAPDLIKEKKKQELKEKKERQEIENILEDIQHCIWAVTKEYCTTWQWLEQGRLPKDNAKWIKGQSYADTVTPDMIKNIYSGDIPLDKLQEYTEQHKDIYRVLWRERIPGSEKYYYCSIDDTYEATTEELAIAEQLYNKREYGYYDGMPWWTSRDQLL